MREFKFRAWENGVMYYQVRCGGVFDGIPTAPTCWNENEGNWFNLTGQPHTAIMQYIGTVDRNDKPIFDGDIVRKIAPHSTIIGKVVVDDGALILKTRDYKRDGTRNENLPEYLPIIVLQSPYQRYEVIGNIYENPELFLNYPKLLEELM